jgi:hypothetical protein
MNPFVLEPNASVTRAPQQIVPKQCFHFIQDARLGNRVQAMTTVITPDAFYQKATGIASNQITPLEHGNRRARIPNKPQGSRQTGGPRA